MRCYLYFTEFVLAEVFLRICWNHVDRQAWVYDIIV